MKLICIIFTIFTMGWVSADEKLDVIVNVDKNVSISFAIKKFIKNENTVTDCGDGYICLINDIPFWGSDGKLPKTMLKNMFVNINGRKTKLDTTGMFNPMVSDKDKSKYQVVNDYNDVWKIRGRFSDGAATYYAEWLVDNGHSIRVVIGDRELLNDAFEHIFKKKQ